MTREEAKEIFLNRGFVNGIFDGDKWRQSIVVISKWLEQEPKTENIGDFEGKTNEDVIISLYPDLKYTIRNGRVVTTIGVASSFDLDWWNAPYQKGSE